MPHIPKEAQRGAGRASTFHLSVRLHPEKVLRLFVNLDEGLLRVYPGKNCGEAGGRKEEVALASGTGRQAHDVPLMMRSRMSP
jgi:hypothetical protein